MQKIISLFQRNYDGDRLVRDEVVPGAEWVMAGEGVATRKFDGTCCMIDERGVLHRRYDCKKGRTAPDGFIPCGEPDPVTGHWPGWVLVGNDPNDQWFREAETRCLSGPGTYELCGPKINGNPEGFAEHILLPHGFFTYYECPRTFAELREWFIGRDIEGIVWHHPDGRMVKIKKRDFGMKRSD